MPIKALIFSRRSLLGTSSASDDALRLLLEWASESGLRLVVFSTHTMGDRAEFSSRSLPDPDLVLTRTDIPGQKAKGSPTWVMEAGHRLGLAPHEFAYVGSDALDWRTAINAAVFYVHAGWAAPTPGGTTAISVESPDGVRVLASHFLLPGPRWEFVLDRPDLGLRVRSLLNANASLPATSASQFTLQDVFTYETDVIIDENNARDLLGLHALTSLYSEGLVRPNSYFALYPSSTPGEVNPVLRQFVRPSARLFHGYYREDLLIRTNKAPDTSLARWRASQQGKTANISIETQANSVRLHEYYDTPSRLRQDARAVIVFDDFTTQGMSLDWARNLFAAGGASDITLVTIGKYGGDLTTYSPTSGVEVEPFKDVTYAAGSFDELAIPMTRDAGAERLLVESFQRWRDGDALPPASYE